MSAVERWRGGVGAETFKSHLWTLRGFEKFVGGHGFSSLEETVKFQKASSGEDHYKIVDLAIEYIKQRGGTYRSMVGQFNAIRSFFLHNRADLPRVRVNWTPTREMTPGRWTLEIFSNLVRSVKPRDQAIYLTLLQGLMDQKRFFQFNTHGYELGTHIKEKGIDVPFRIDFMRGRKTNPQPFNSWLGHDALEAWERYFDQVRGYPKEGEMAALVWNHKQKQLHPIALRLGHLYNLRKLGYIKGKGKLATRYGLGLHELRDLARSLLEKAKEANFNTLSAEYWMGHTVDRMFYNKIWTLDPEYNLGQYRIAERYLNIVSGSAGVSEAQSRIKELEERLAKLEAVYTKEMKVKVD